MSCSRISDEDSGAQCLSPIASDDNELDGKQSSLVTCINLHEMMAFERSIGSMVR